MEETAEVTDVIESCGTNTYSYLKDRAETYLSSCNVPCKMNASR